MQTKIQSYCNLCAVVLLLDKIPAEHIKYPNSFQHYRDELRSIFEEMKDGFERPFDEMFEKETPCQK